jgi:hypothetical protein
VRWRSLARAVGWSLTWAVGVAAGVAAGAYLTVVGSAAAPGIEELGWVELGVLPLAAGAATLALSLAVRGAVFGLRLLAASNHRDHGESDHE